MKIAAVLLAIAPAFALAGNYATCLLKNLPGLQNEVAARAAINLCMSEYPGGINSVPQGDGRGFLGYDSGAECAMKKAGETRSQLAGQGIYLACRRLYDSPQPNPFDDLIPGGEKRMGFTPLEEGRTSAPMTAEQFIRSAPPAQQVSRPSSTRQDTSSAEQREYQRKREWQSKCNIQPVMTDAEIEACRNAARGH